MTILLDNRDQLADECDKVYLFKFFKIDLKLSVKRIKS
jgi:hypothetical protein